MLLAFDIGNSGVSFGAMDLSGKHPSVVAKFRIASLPRRSRDEYILLISDILCLHGIDKNQIDAVAISSVVPSLTKIIADAAAYLTKCTPLVVGPGVRTGLNIRVDSQTQLGADIVSNAVAAVMLTPAPVVVIDMGTATTLTAVDASSTLIGTVICPGLAISMDALSSSASLIGDSDFSRPAQLIGKNTHDSVNSGVVNGHIIMIDGFIREYRSLLATDSDTRLSLIATGGLSEFVVPYCRNKCSVVPGLTLLGIAEIYRRNQK